MKVRKVSIWDICKAELSGGGNSGTRNGQPISATNNLVAGSNGEPDELFNTIRDPQFKIPGISQKKNPSKH